MATRTLYLIRHGDYIPIDNAVLGKNPSMEARYQRACEVGGLTLLGTEQAEVVAERLKPLPITAIHTSTMLRAVETAEIIATQFPKVRVNRSDKLWECIPAVPPPPHDRGILKKHTAAELAEQQGRAEHAFDHYFKRARGRDKHEIIVAHGNLIRYFICRALNVAPEPLVLGMDLCNCSVSEVLIHANGRMMLVAYNDVGFMPYRLLSCLGAKKFTYREFFSAVAEGRL
jgi:serine/threonine-protein phosphatase PGAM5